MRKLVGYVNGTKLDKNEVRVAWLRPIFEQKGQSWEPVVAHDEEFPSRGYVFWYDAQNLERGTPVQFSAKENEIRKEGGDDYVAVDARTLHEVIDLRRYGECEGVRKALMAGIPNIPTGKHLVWCGEDQVIGPVQLATNSTGETTLDRSNRAKIGSFQFRAGEVLTFNWEDGPRTVVVKLGQPQAFVDWDDDVAVLRRAIKHAVESSSSAHFPKQAIDEFAERLVRGGGSGENHLEQYRLDRLRSIARNEEALREASEDVVQFLLKHPLVVSELKKVHEAEAKRARSEIEEALRGIREETTRLEKRAEELIAANDDASRRLSEAEARIEGECASVERRVQERLSAVLSDPPGLLAEVALLKPFFGRREEVESRPAAKLLYPPWQRSSKPLANAMDLKRRLLAAFKSFGVESGAYQPIHAAFVGGLLPILGGSHAVEAIQAYAHVVARGRCAVVQVTSATADVQDLFGRVVQGRYVPEASGLIDIVRAANASSGLFVIALEGINRGPTESYLLPLIRSAVRQSGEISLFHPTAVSSTDPYRDEAKLKWPENLLLAATVLEGPTTLPVTPALWADSVYVDVQAGPHDGMPCDPTDVSQDLLQPDIERVDVEWVREVLPSAERTAFRFEGGLRTVTSNGLAMAVARSVIVPMAALMPDEAEFLAKAAEKELGTSIEALVGAARRRLT